MTPRPRVAAFFILAGFIALATAYVLRIAPGNTPDERAHVYYVVSLSRGELPAWDWPTKPDSYEAHQPPLYYFFGGAVLKLCGRLSMLSQFKALRFLSVLMHLGALVLLWLMATRVNGGELHALGPLALMASLPMFTFIGASVTNDAAADLAGALLLWLATAADRKSILQKPLIWGAILGTAFLCKLTVLAPAGVCLYSLWKRSKPRLSAPALGLGSAGLICGWFYLRNAVLYKSLTGLGRTQLYDPNRYAWSELGTWLRLYFQSFWGRFGQMTQPMPPVAYDLAAAATVVVVAGWIRHWDELSARPARKKLLAALCLAAALNFYYGFFRSYQPQARLSFVVLSAWAVLFWDGLWIWTRNLLPRNAALCGWGLVILAIAMQAWALGAL